MAKLLLIDGHSILTRAYYGIPLLTASGGVHTNAVYGFLNIMLKFIDDEHADRVMAAFDMDRHSLRRIRIYPEYKGNRKPMPGELLEQVPIIQRVLSAMGIPVLMLEGYEADDILGTVAKRAVLSGEDVTIVSGDRDLLQLSSPHIKISVPKTSKGRTEVFEYYPEDVLREYQVTPEQFVELKALMGDSSDNIPGLPGVGPKTATEIIKKYGSIENARAHADEIRPPRAQKAFAEHYDLAELSRVLAAIDTDVPIDTCSGGGSVSGIYTSEALSIMRELELKSLAARFASHMEEGADTNGSAGISTESAKIVRDRFLAGVVLGDAAGAELFGMRLFCTEKQDSAVLGVALSADRTYSIVSGKDYPAAELISDIAGTIKKSIAAGNHIATSGLKGQLKYINIEPNAAIFDTEIAMYLIDPNRSSYGYDNLASDMLGAAVRGEKELIGKGSIFEMLGAMSYEQETLFDMPAGGKSKKKVTDGSAAVKNALEYTVLNALVPFLSYKKLLKRMSDDGTLGLFNNMEMPLVYALDDMEKAGVRVDGASLDAYADFLKSGIDTLTAEIYALAGEEFNINSPQQLGTVLFEKLGIKGAKKTRTGYSTEAKLLEKLAPDHEIIAKVLRYRALAKLYSTYARGLTAFISPDGRIHGTFNQTIAATGRISSTEPNLQNIPVRTAEGREIRKVFVPAEGYVFVDADYSQIELRVLASLSGDEALISAYNNSVDIHTLTASQVFHVAVEEVTPEMRRGAKAVNFGIVYGISAFGLGEDLSISRKEASDYIDQYFTSYPGVKEYLEKCVKEARERGFSRTYFGRIRPVPELKSSNYMQRSFGERIAMNSPIQGTAADIMKIAMIRVNRALKGMGSRIVLQVHDELLIETVPGELEKVISIVRDCMEHAADLKVSLNTDIRSGMSWYECH